MIVLTNKIVEDVVVLKLIETTYGVELQMSDGIKEKPVLAFYNDGRVVRACFPSIKINGAFEFDECGRIIIDARPKT